MIWQFLFGSLCFFRSLGVCAVAVVGFSNGRMFFCSYFSVVVVPSNELHLFFFN